jgi:hypothetical protein
MRCDGPRPDKRVAARAVGQGKVQQQHIEGPLLQQRHRFRPGLGQREVEPGGSLPLPFHQRLLEQDRVRAAVFDEQNCRG